MKKLIPIIAVTFLFVSFTVSRTRRTDCVELNLKGSVFTLRETTYRAAIKDGDTLKEMQRAYGDMFNPDGNKISENYTERGGDNAEKRLYSYDTLGYPIEELHTDTDGKTTMRIKYEYRKSGSFNEIWYYPDGSMNIKYLHFTNQTITGFRVTKSSYKPADDDVPNSPITYWGCIDTEYDSLGNILFTRQLSKDDSILGKTTYKDDKYGNPIEITNYSDGKVPDSDIVTCKYVYDKKHNWTKEFTYENGELVGITERQIGYY